MREVVFERICRVLAIFFMICYILFDLRYQVSLFVDVYGGLGFGFWDFLGLYKFDIIQYSIMILAILILMKYQKGGVATVMCACAIVIAVDCAIEAYLLLIDYRTLVIDLEFFLEGVVSLVVAAMLFFNTITFMRGLSKSANLIKYAVLTLLILQLLAIIISIRSGETFDQLVEKISYSFAFIDLQILVLIMTSSKAIKQKSIMGSIGTSIRDMRTMMTEEGIGIDRPIAAKFSDYNANGLWCAAYSFALTSFKGGKYAMTLTRSGDRMSASVSSAENHSGMNSFRFNLRGIWFDTGDAQTCDLMRFYGDDGVFIQLIVRNVPAPKMKKAPKIGMIILISREVGTRTHKINVTISELAFKFNDWMKSLRPKKKNKGEE